MAQTGYTPILIYSSSTGGNAPAAGNLTNSTLGSELAINITDGKLFYKDNANAVQVIGWKTTPTSAGGTGLTSYTAGDLLYYVSGTTLATLAIGASGRWLGSSGTAPQWNAPAALTKTDDTNVTLTLGGSASTALLNAASLTLGWTGQLAASRGGTGIGSYTVGDLLYASGTTALSKLAIGTANYVLTSSGSAPQWTAASAITFPVSYLVVAGGGPGGVGTNGGGGGAGGYRSNIGTSGGGVGVEGAFLAVLGTAYQVTVGGGGAFASTGGPSAGSNSTFSSIVSTGGGNGAGRNNDGQWDASTGGSGGAGNGESYTAGKAATFPQGYAGGNGDATSGQRSGGGGGGASAAGGNAAASSPAAGGAGITSILDNVARGGGGGGNSQAGTGGSGGSGGGGAGNGGGAGTAGTANTGGGGGAGTTSGGSGGSGVIVLRIPDSRTATFTGGVTQTSTTSGGFKTYTITAAGSGDTVTFT